MTERVFITGIAGFLGSHLADAFLNAGWEVAGNDNLSDGYVDNVPADAEFHDVDCLDHEALAACIDDADIVYHTAALPYEGLSVFAPSSINRSVYQGTSTTLTATINADVGRFVYCSSMSRYGDNDLPFTEELDPRPQDPYGLSKLSAERLTRMLADTHGFDYAIAIPHNIIGPRQRYDDPYRNVAAIFINRMLRGEQPIIYGDGSQKRSFTYVQDAVRPLVKLGTAEEAAGETFNIGPDEEFVSINRLAEVIADVLDFDLDPIYEPKRPQEVELAYCSADKAREHLGYETRYTLRESIECMVSWISERGPKHFDYHLDIEIKTNQTPNTWVDELI